MTQDLAVPFLLWAFVIREKPACDILLRYSSFPLSALSLKMWLQKAGGVEAVFSTQKPAEVLTAFCGSVLGYFILSFKREWKLCNLG